jgi:hypothetical protein
MKRVCCSERRRRRRDKDIDGVAGA